MKTLYEHAGGHDALYRFVDISNRTVLADPLLQPLWRPESQNMSIP